MTTQRLAGIGVALVLIGGISYWFLMDVPWIRSAAIPNTVLIVVGLALCGAALWQQRSGLTIAAAILGGLVGGGFLISLFVLMQLPPPERNWSGRDEAPDFTLPNQDGRPVTLSSFRGRGPVLLVFYRGHW